MATVKRHFSIIYCNCRKIVRLTKIFKNNFLINFNTVPIHWHQNPTTYTTELQGTQQDRNTGLLYVWLCVSSLVQWIRSGPIIRSWNKCTYWYLLKKVLVLLEGFQYFDSIHLSMFFSPGAPRDASRAGCPEESVTSSTTALLFGLPEVHHHLAHCQVGFRSPSSR